MSFETLKWQQEGEIGVLTLSRPQALNALNGQLIGELERFFAEPKTGLRALIITGDGEKSFVAGADIKEMESMGPNEARAMARRGQKLFDRISSSPFAVIAAVNGFALGGGLELALSCDFIIASRKARFGLPEVSLGLIPGYGGTQRLSRSVGLSVARMMTLTGDMFTADQGEKWGLFPMVVEPDELMSVARKVASTIASRGPKAVALAKDAMARGHDVSLSEGLSIEAECFAQTFATQDKQEGIRAFTEKRAPKFSGQ